MPRAKGQQTLVKVYPDLGARERRGVQDHSFVGEWLSQYDIEGLTAQKALGMVNLHSIED